MSEHEAAARYEHATTLLDWHHAIDAPPPVKPPTSDDGWMLFSQTPTPSASGDVTRFLCVWRRRLVRVEDRRPTRADWKAKKEEERKAQEQEREAQRQRWKADEAIRLEQERRDAAKRIQEARLVGVTMWEAVRHIEGVRALAFDASPYTVCKWLLFFHKGTPDRHEKTKDANRAVRGIGLKEKLVQRVEMVYVGKETQILESNDPTLPVSRPPDILEGCRHLFTPGSDLAVKVPESSMVDRTATPVTKTELRMIATESVNVQKGEEVRISLALRAPSKPPAAQDDDEEDLLEGLNVY